MRVDEQALQYLLGRLEDDKLTGEDKRYLWLIMINVAHQDPSQSVAGGYLERLVHAAEVTS